MSKKDKEYDKYIAKMAKDSLSKALELIPDVEDADFPEKRDKITDYNDLINFALTAVDKAKEVIEKEIAKNDDAPGNLVNVRMKFVGILRNFKIEFDKISELNGGETIKTKTLKKADALVNTFAMVDKILFDSIKEIEKIQMSYSVENGIEQVENYEAELKAFADSIHKSMPDVDFSDVDSKASALKAEYDKITSGIKKAEEELGKLNNSPAKSDALVELFEKSKALSGVLADVERDTNVLDGFLSRLDILDAKGDDIKRGTEEINNSIAYVKSQTESNNVEIEKINESIKEYDKLVDEALKQKETLFDKNLYSEDEASGIYGATNLKTEIDRLREIQELFSKSDVNDKVRFWLAGFNPMGDLSVYTKEKEDELRKLYVDSNNKEEFNKYMAAKDLIFEAVGNDNTASDIWKSFRDGADGSTIRNEILVELAKKQNEYAIKLDRLALFKRTCNYDEIVTEFANSDKQYNEASANISALKALTKQLNEETTSNESKVEELFENAKKIQNLDFIADSLKTYKEMLNNSLLDQDKVKEIKEKCNSLIANQESLKEKYNKDEYEKLLADVSLVGKELKKNVAESAATIKNKGVNAREDLVKNGKEIEKTIVSQKEVQNSLLTRLRAEECGLKIKLDATNAIKLKQDMLNEKSKAIASGFKTTYENATTMSSGLEKILLQNTLERMLSMYNRMNDCRRNETNSPEYNAMAKPFCACIGFKDVPDIKTDCKNQKNFGPETVVGSVHDLMANLANIKDAAEKYLHEKKGNKWWHTKQYHQRVTWAKELIANCDVALEQYTDLIRVQGEVVKPLSDRVKEKTEFISKISGKDNAEFGKYLNGLANEEAKKENVVEVKKNEKAEVKNYAK